MAAQFGHNRWARDDEERLPQRVGSHCFAAIGREHWAGGSEAGKGLCRVLKT